MQQVKRIQCPVNRCLATAVGWGILLLLVSEVFGAEDPEVLVEVSHTQVYEGQPIRYDVTLNHIENPSAPELKGFEDFEVEFEGERSLNSSQVTIINGRMTKVVRRGQLYRYQLTPRKSGTLTIPGPVVEVDGQRLVGPQRTVTVLPAEDQDVVYMEITSSDSEVYPMQPFTVTLTVAVKELDPPLAGESPVSVQRRLRSPQPALRIPWIDSVPEGLEAESDLNAWAKPLLRSRAAGFSINGLTTGSSSVFSFFDEQDAASFLPEARQVTRADKDGKQVTYWEYDFSRTFLADKIGPVTFGPASVKGMFVRRVDEDRRAAVEEIYAIARPIQVMVKDVPRQGRPESFTGAVGEFQWRAQLEPVRARVGDPMTLTVTLTGKGTLGSTSAPDLTAISEIAERFKVYEATEEIKPNSARFTFGLRPKVAGDEAFPPIPLTYFDVESERYVTLETESIPITIDGAEWLAADEIVSSAPAGGGQQREIELQKEGIFANITDRVAFRDQSVRPGRWLIFLLTLAGLYGVIATGTRQWRRLSADQALRRRRGAAAAARQRLQEAMRQFSDQHPRHGVDLIQNAFVWLVADVTDRSAVGLTPKDIHAELARLNIQDSLLSQVDDLLDRCDAARYGTSDRDERLVDEARQTLDVLIAALKSQKRFR